MLAREKKSILKGIIMKKLVIGILATSLVGCANIKVTEPAEHVFDRSQTFKIPFEKVWVSAVDWFADHNVTIEKIEKESGLITAKYLLKASDAYLDCGTIEVNGTLGPAQIQSLGSLNVTVRSVSDTETKVNANFFGEYKLNGRDAWDGSAISRDGRCVSTGNLEKDILKYISR